MRKKLISMMAGRKADDSSVALTLKPNCVVASA